MIPGRLLPCALLALLLIVAPRLAAQEGTWIGVGGAFDVGVISSGRTTQRYAEWCDCDLSGTSFFQQSHISLSTIFPPLIAGTSGTIVQLGIGSQQTRFTSGAYPLAAGSDSSLEYFEDERTTTLRLGLLGSIAILPQLQIVAGPWARVPTRVDATQEEVLIAPSGAVFPSGSTRRTIATETARAGPSRFGAAIGAALALPLDANITLYPFAQLEVDPAALLARRPRGLALGGGSMLVIRLLRTAADPPVVPMALAVPAPAPSATLELGIDEGGRFGDTGIVRAVITRHRMSLPLPRQIVPSEGEGSGYARLDRGEAASFDPRGLGRAADTLLAPNLLNVVGWRMKYDRSSTLRLVVASSKGADASRARRNAREMRLYLIRTWGVGPDRISVVAGDLDDESAIVLQSSDDVLLSPLHVEWLERSFRLPLISIRHEVSAAAGMRDISVVVRRGGELVARQHGADVGLPLGIALDVSDSNDGNASVWPLVAELDLVDSLGREARAFDTLALTLPATERFATMLTPARTSWHVPYPKSLGDIDEIVREIEPGDRVNIRYHDFGLDDAKAALVRDMVRVCVSRAMERGGEVQTGRTTERGLVVEVER